MVDRTIKEIEEKFPELHNDDVIRLLHLLRKLGWAVRANLKATEGRGRPRVVWRFPEIVVLDLERVPGPLALRRICQAEAERDYLRGEPT